MSKASIQSTSQPHLYHGELQKAIGAHPAVPVTALLLITSTNRVGCELAYKCLSCRTSKANILNFAGSESAEPSNPPGPLASFCSPEVSHPRTFNIAFLNFSRSPSWAMPWILPILKETPGLRRRSGERIWALDSQPEVPVVSIQETRTVCNLSAWARTSLARVTRRWISVQKVSSPKSGYPFINRMSQ